MPKPAFSDSPGVLIESIYGASLDDSLWHDTLAGVSEAFGGVGSVVVRGRAPGGKLELTWIQEHVPQIEGRWDHYMAYRDLDVRTAHALCNPPHTVYTDYDYIGDRAIDRHPFYQEFMATYDLRYTVGARFPADGGEFGIINVFRNQRQGHPQRREVELLGALLPHLTHACEVDQRLAAARRTERPLREALDRVPDAILLVEPDGRIVDTNRAAEHLLRQRDGLSAPQSRLTASHHATRQPLAEAIAAAARRLVHPPAARALPIPRPAGGRPLHALIMPMPRADSPALPVASPLPLVMLVVSDPRLPTPLPERLAALWHLTPAESRLAAALAAGASVQDYADERALTDNTVRWTLKRLLAKTDCRRQPELIRLLSTAASFW